MSAPAADVCLLLEGTYPFVAGGVASWVHDLLGAHAGLTFDIVAMVPDSQPREPRYPRPANLRHVIPLPLQDPPLGSAGAAPRPEALALLERFASGRAGLAELVAFETARAAQPARFGRRPLLDSEPAFAATCAAYQRAVPGASFLDFFWSWRALLNGTLATLLLPVPAARCYHAVSTGFAGLLGARLAACTGRPLLLSEHGIYTNERRIEIAMADWLHANEEASLAADKSNRDLRDFWIAAFEGFARLTYAAADPIITLHRANQALQLRDGAAAERLAIIPNGIDADRFAAIPVARDPARPVVALIGRVVPIKDIKTFIRACALLRGLVPEAAFELLGPTEEDPGYAEECRLLVHELGLGDVFFFRGRVPVMEWLGRIDVNVLTSISEAQPLTILEAGAAGVPCVATDVGACREMIEGDADGLGAGGAVTPVADPGATARAIAGLLLDRAAHARAAAVLQARIRARYLKRDVDAAYAALYARATAAPDARQAA
jgi:glycosyltransferase involved in cell wall biosynthesis